MTSPKETDGSEAVTSPDDACVACTDYHCQWNGEHTCEAHRRMTKAEWQRSAEPLSDWTNGNSSLAYRNIVGVVEGLLANHRIGTPTEVTARLIVSQLAHEHGLAPVPEALRKP